MVAVAEAAEVAGAPDLDNATTDQMTKAWGLVRRAADVSLIDLTTLIAEQSHLRVAQLDAAEAHAALLIPAEVAHRRNVLPLACTDRDITVGTANPLSQTAKREISAVAGRKVVFQVASPNDLSAAVIARYGALSDEQRLGSGAKRPETAQPAGPHVLVVDDEAGQRALFRSVLEEAGYRVTVASDGPEAIRLMEADSSYHLVTLDYWMNEMNGLRVLQHIRAEPSTSTLPVIMVTGTGDRRIEMSLFEAGVDDYIAKPIDGPLFVLRVQAVLRRRQFA